MLCAAFFLIAQSVHYLRFLALDFVTANFDSVTLTADAEMLMLRDEMLVLAPAEGEFIPAVSDGSRVSVGNVIGYMEAEQSGTLSTLRTEVLASLSGIVYFTLDGWEETLSPESVAASDRSQLVLAYENTAEAAFAADQIQSWAAGRPVAKIWDNLSSCAMMIYLAEDPYAFLDNGVLNLSLAEHDDLLSTTVYEQGMLADGRYYLLAECQKIKFSQEARHFTVSLIGKTYEGIQIETCALFVNESGQRGVYRANKKQLVFTEVEIVKEFGDMVFVEGLREGDRIVRNPEKAVPGQRLYGKQ